MKFVQRLSMVIAGLAVAAALLTILSPKAHALVATLVEVANTRATPVPNQDVDSAARHPYQQSCQDFGVDFQTCTMPVVPPNIEVVIQTVSMQVTGAAPTLLQFATTGGGVNIFTNIPSPGQTGPFYVATQSLTQYVDPGTSAACYSNTTGTAVAALSCSVSGYFVTLP
jgi:hypothetical protein